MTTGMTADEYEEEIKKLDGADEQTAPAIDTNLATRQQNELDGANAIKQQEYALQDTLFQQGQATLDKTKQSSQQSANIGLQATNKYLADTAKASGLAMGQQGTNYLNAQSQYTTQRAKINDDFATANNNLLNDYNAQRLNTDMAWWNSEQGILDKYLGLQREDEQTAYDRSIDTRNYDRSVYESDRAYDYQVSADEYQKAWQEDERAYQRQRDARNDLTDSQTKQFNYIQSSIDEILASGEYNSLAGWESYLETNKGYLDTQDYNYLKQKIAGLKESEFYKEWNTATAGGTQQAAAETTETAQNENNARTRNDGSIVMDYNGKTYTATKELANVGTDNWDDFWALLNPVRAGEVWWNSISSIWGGGYAKKQKEVKDWFAKGKNGELADGAIIDISASGTNDKKVMYYGGKFYEMSK